jgi:hypothetical protein
MTRVRVAPGPSHWSLIFGRRVAIPAGPIIEVTQEELAAVLRNGGKRVD